ncbi:MAG: insulinase family protein, partial [Bacteroidota bacterium]
IVFQEIRESKALAYSTYAMNTSPSKKDEAHYLKAYVGTQPDKVQDAIITFQDILNNIPLAKEQIEQSRLSLIKKIESERVVPKKRFWQAQQLKDKGLFHDIRKDLYDLMINFDISQLIEFHEERIKNRHYNYMLLGDWKSQNHKFLETIGPVKQVTLEDILGED